MKISMTVGALLAAFVAAPAFADTVTLTGTLRDFRKDTHPDFQKSGGGTSVVKGLVKTTLGDPSGGSKFGVPVLNTNSNYASAKITSANSFSQWYRDVPGVNKSVPFILKLDNGRKEPGGVYRFQVDKNIKDSRGKPMYFFPIGDPKYCPDPLFNDLAKDANGDLRNFYFTLELHTEFLYNKLEDRDLNGNGIKGEPFVSFANPGDALVFNFHGDDDVWVFVNKKLVVDIGGVHAQASGRVNIDEVAAQIGLEPGKTYPLDFYFAERYLTESNFRIETTVQFTKPDALYD